MLQVEHWPELESPLLVASLTGWVDAGFAGAGAIRALTSAAGARTFARDLLVATGDLVHDRPRLTVQAGFVSKVAWPQVRFLTGRLGRDVVFVTGPEPAQGWRRLLDETVELADGLGIAAAYFLSGMPAPVPHTRPIQVRSTVAGAPPIDAPRDDYDGPTGLQTLLQFALGDAGIPSYGLWAQVPPYVASVPSPPAVRALLTALGEASGLEVELGAIPGEEDYAVRLERVLEDRPDIAELVGQLEAVVDAAAADDPDAAQPAPELGEQLAAEIERFLRDID